MAEHRTLVKSVRFSPEEWKAVRRRADEVALSSDPSRGDSGFGGLLRYLVHGDREHPDPERVVWTAVHNRPTEDPQLSARIMRATADMNERGVEKPVWHLSLSWHPEDDPFQEQMREASERVLEKLGNSEHQAVLVAHGDTDHAHVHVVVNRVHPETRSPGRLDTSGSRAAL